jgi:hypothetical protein
MKGSFFQIIRFTQNATTTAIPPGGRARVRKMFTITYAKQYRLSGSVALGIGRPTVAAAPPNDLPS